MKSVEFWFAKILKYPKMDVETAQAELLNISEWMRINKLSLNPTKTEYIIIDHPRRRKIGESLPQLFINGEKNQTG